jgi:hypothetical protein
MRKTVVDAFEMIHIENGDGIGRSGLLRFPQGMLQRAAVVEAGQRIFQIGLFQPVRFLRQLQIGHFERLCLTARGFALVAQLLGFILGRGKARAALGGVGTVAHVMLVELAVPVERHSVVAQALIGFGQRLAARHAGFQIIDLIGMFDPGLEFRDRFLDPSLRDQHLPIAIVILGWRGRPVHLAVAANAPYGPPRCPYRPHAARIRPYCQGRSARPNGPYAPAPDPAPPA